MEGQFIIQSMTVLPQAFTMKELIDVKGQRVNVEKLASDYLLIVITLKNAECPVCVQLLQFLNVYGLDPDMAEYYMPFEGRAWNEEPEQKKLFKLLLTKDTYFIVICPGSEERVAQVQQSVPFMLFPFIGGEQAMRIARELSMKISDTELWPAIFAIESTLNTDIVKLGRSLGDASHRILIEYLYCKRLPLEHRGLYIMEKARQTIVKLKLKVTKCREGRLVTMISLLRRPSPPPTIPTPKKNIQNQDWNALPPEILEHILSFIPEIQHVAKAARTSRMFYIAYCNVFMERLREQSTKVRYALPSSTDQLKERGVNAYQGVDRWWHDPDGVGIRELERRVDGLTRLLQEIPGDVRNSLQRGIGRMLRWDD